MGSHTMENVHGRTQICILFFFFNEKLSRDYIDIFHTNIRLITCTMRIRVRVVEFNATFNNISVISWDSVLIGGGNRTSQRKPPTYCKSLTNFIT